MKRRVADLALAVLLGVTSGCTVIEPKAPIKAHELSPDLSLVRVEEGTGTSLFLSPVRGAPSYATSQMAYRQRRYEVDYFTQNAWTAEPARLLEPWLIAALERSAAFDYVVSGSSAPPTELRLDVDLLVLRHEFDATPSQVRARLRAVLIDAERRSVLGAREFETVEPSATADAYGGVVAGNQALARLLAEVTAFAAQASRAPAD